jgi:hypothetical protein
MMRRVAVLGIACLSAFARGGEVAARPIPAVQEGAPQPESPKKPAEKSVTGTVVNRDGEGLAGARVTIKGPKTATVWTDANGSFHFAGRPGTYEITVKAGERSHKFTATIDEAAGLQPDTFTFGE